ncbi:MAG: condensation domain-containing protein, partial [Bacilli bacterium]|nr:condensation domain-containing protein [Bacilli bacterium]
HHIISDATTRTIINKELEGEITNNIDLNFIKKANQELKERYSEKYESGRIYYEKMFADSKNIIEPIGDINNKYGGLAFVYLGDIKEKLISTANRLSITVNHILTSAFAYTLSRFINNNKPRFTFANHGRNLDGLDNAIGMFVRTVPIALDTSDRLVDIYLKESSKQMLNSMENSVYPFRLLANQHHLNQNIMFEYNTNLNDVDFVTKRFLIIKDNKKDMPHIANLFGIVNNSGKGITFTVDYSNKYNKTTIIRFMKTYQKVLYGLISNDYLRDINYSIDVKLKTSKSTNIIPKEIVLKGLNNENLKYAKAYILDKEHRLVPYGAVGELYLSSSKLSKVFSKGNKEFFFKNPFDGNKLGYERMYKTGDLVRYLPNGTLAFVGRIDSKISNRRIAKLQDKIKNNDNLYSNHYTPVSELEKKIVECICKLLNIKTKNLNLNSDLRNFGLDSLTALRLSYLYNKELNVDIRAIDIINCTTLKTQILLVKKMS